MKKLNFMAVEKELSRAEMKKIMAGSGGGDCGAIRCHGADANCPGTNGCYYCTNNSGPGDNSVCSTSPY